MILPFFDGLLNFKKAPITWLLIFINVFFGVLFFADHQLSVNKFFKDKYFVDSQVSIYKNFILTHKDTYSLEKISYAQRINDLTPRHKIQFSALAFMDENFRSFIASKPENLDSVALEYLINKYNRIEKTITDSFEFYFGLQTFDWYWVSLFSYQFMHGGWFHLFSNMLILLIVGGFLEARQGGFRLFILYLLSGLGAGLLFLKFNTNSLTPLVGASGSISGILSFVCLMYWDKPIKYFWLVGFNKWTYGFVWLPAWITLVFWLMQDFAGMMANLSEMGGISFTAHIGGHIVGLSCALIILAFQYSKKTIDQWHPAITDPH